MAANGVIAVMTSESAASPATRAFATLQLQQGRAEHADEVLCGAPRRRSTRPFACRARLGAHGHGHVGRPLWIEGSISFVVETVERSRGKPGLRLLIATGGLCPGEIDNKRKGRQSWIFRRQGSPRISSQPAHDERCNPHPNGGLHVCYYRNTGRVGGTVADSLLKAGLPVRALVRDKAKAAPGQHAGPRSQLPTSATPRP